MRKMIILCIISFFIGILSVPRPAYAFISIAPIVTAITLLQTAMNSVVNGMGHLLNDTLGDGFTQLSNYMKAQIGAQEQISDANNMVQARLARDLRNANIRDNHSVNRQDCLNLEGGQAAVVAAHNSSQVSVALDSGKNNRNQARKNTPAWNGTGQAAQANNNRHFSLYCSDAEGDAGLCNLSSTEDQGADQSASSLLDAPVYANQKAIDKANDYETTLIEPVPEGALRGDQLRTPEGQSALPGRRSYNAAMSLSHHVADEILGWRAATVSLSPAQKAEAQRENLPNTEMGSQYEATELEINRKYSGPDWQADLQAMSSSKAVLIQIANIEIQRNWIEWQNFKLNQQRALMEADILSIEARSRLRPVSPMPTPSSTLN